ncbi:FHA domain-containing protein [Burkholderia cepacia]|nr:FHA domain-containing protein [Burkholderia cepacia]
MQRLELLVANTHALRAGSTARHNFGHAGGTIGSRGADWLLDDGQGQVQAIHCEITWIDNSYCVRDQSGATRVNDAETPLRRGTAARLRDGDVLHIGAYQVTVHLQISEAHLTNSQPLLQRSVGELLNEPGAGLPPRPRPTDRWMRGRASPISGPSMILRGSAGPQRNAIRWPPWMPSNSGVSRYSVLPRWTLRTTASVPARPRPTTPVPDSKPCPAHPRPYLENPRCRSPTREPSRPATPMP